MKNILKFKKISSYIILILTIPIITITLYKLGSLQEAYSELNQIKSVDKLAKLSIIQSAVVHELQKERGRTSGYFTSKGAKFNVEIKSQRVETDKSIIALDEYLSTFDPSSYDTIFISNLFNSKQKLMQINELRSKCDKFEGEAKDYLTYYTSTINMIITNVNFIADFAIVNDTLYKNLMAYYNLAEYKERLGKSRAVFAGIFAKNKFDDYLYSQASQLETERKIFFDKFYLYAYHNQREEYFNVVKGDPVTKTEEMMKNAMSNKVADSLNISPAIWFDEITKRIDLVKQIEDKFANNIVERSAMLISDAENDLIIDLTWAVLGTIATFWLAIWVMINMSKDLKKAQLAADSVANGNINIDLNTERIDEIGMLFQSMQVMTKNINQIVTETDSLIVSVSNGNLTKRGNENEFSNSWKELIAKINQLIETFVAPIKVTEECLDNISKGNIPPPIKSNFKGDFNHIIESLNNSIHSINELVVDAKSLADAAVVGNLSVRADASKHRGDFRAIVEGVNNTLESVIGPLTVAADYVNRISKGDIPKKITDEYFGDFNEIKNNLNTCIDAVNALVADAKMLSGAAIEGKLSTRADASKHYGDFRAIVEGVNNTLDSVIGPLNVAAEYVDRISKGDIPSKISDDYNGDFNEIKNNLNTCIDAVNALVADAKMLSVAAINGKLSTRADASKHYGDFRAIVDGVNNTLDSVIGPLNVAAEYVENISKGQIPAKITAQYNGDFNEIKNNLNMLIENLNSFNNEMSKMEDEQNAGDLDYFIDESKFEGAYKSMVQGVNGLVRSNIIAINDLINCISEYGKGNFKASIAKYPGKKAKFNNAIDNVQFNLNKLANAVNDLIDGAKRGELSIRGNASSFSGDWNQIVSGLNELLEAIVVPINESDAVLAELASGNLNAKMIGHYEGDLNRLKENINNLADSLNEVITQFQESIEATASLADDLAHNAESMAAAAQEQSAQADEVAGAVEEMSHTITQNANAALHTSEMAETNGAVANEGGAVVQNTVNKMRDIANVVKQSAQNIEELGKSSEKIGAIIVVIDDIADQTNLLALNAAIEAARAGEQGRGFAVVADEVRKLAERTSEATKQISNMIKGIQYETESAVQAMHKGTKEAEIGISLADQAGNSLQQIVESTKELINMVSNIAAASEEQSATSEEISKNVVSISQVSAETAQNIQTVAKTAEDLNALTENLRSLVARFQLRESNNTHSLHSSNTHKYLN